VIARLFSRLSAAEASPTWGLLTAFNSIIVAYIMIVVGTFVGAYFVTQTTPALQIGWIVGCLLITGFVALSRRRDREALRLEGRGSALILAVLFSLGVAILFDVLSLAVTRQFLPVPELLGLVQQSVAEIRLSPGEIVAAFLLMVIAQPIAEELVFRSIALPVLRQAFGPWLGLVVCALAYGLFHLLAYSSPTGDPTLVWYGLALPILVGLVIGGVRVVTGSTRAAIVSHMAFGLFALLKALTLAG
jgi:membrane protease YdiL (CAAX protease family)